MNRGTSLKWVEALRNTEHHFDNSQLMFPSCFGVMASPLGILCEFLDPDGFVNTGVCGFSWHGASFYMPEPWLVKCKSTGKGLLPADGPLGEPFYQQIDQIIDRHGMMTNRKFDLAADWIAENYETL